MKILFDHCVPNPLRRAFPLHDIQTAAEMKWESLRNGKLLAAAAGSFDVLLTVDKNIRFEQNLSKLPIRVIVLDAPRNTPDVLVKLAPFVEAALPNLAPGKMIEIDAAGNVMSIN